MGGRCGDLRRLLKPAWLMITGIYLGTSFRRASVGRPMFICRAAVSAIGDRDGRGWIRTDIATNRYSPLNDSAWIVLFQRRPQAPRPRELGQPPADGQGVAGQLARRRARTNAQCAATTFGRFPVK